MCHKYQLHNFNPKFHCLKTNVCAKLFLKLQLILEEMTEFQNSIQD